MLAWNDLHEKLGLLFVVIIDRHQREIEENVPHDERPHLDLEIERWAGIWSSSHYDRPKRAMLSALLNPVIEFDFRNLPKFKADIEWLLKEADKLEDIRNNAVHVPLWWIGNSPVFKTIAGLHDIDVIPNLRMGNKRAVLVAKKDLRSALIKEFRWARDACLILRDFAVLIERAILIDGAPWPRRPSLPNRGDRRKSQAPKRPGPKQ